MSIVAGPLSDNRLQVFVYHQGAIWTTWQPSSDPSSGWLPWSRMQGTDGIQCVAAAQLANGALSLYAVSTAAPPSGGAMYTEKLSSDVTADWSGFSSLFESSYVLSIAVVPLPLSACQVQAFIWANDPNIVYTSPGQLYTNFKSGPDFTDDFTVAKFFDPTPPWGRIPQPGGPAAGLVLAAPLADNEVQLWINGPSPDVPFWTTWKNGDVDSPWQPWAQFEKVPDPNHAWQLAVGVLPDRRLQLWAFSDTAPDLYSCWKQIPTASSPWTPWTRFSGAFDPGVSSLAVAPLSDRRLQIWVLDKNDQIWSTWKLSSDPDADWAPWSAFLPLP